MVIPTPRHTHVLKDLESKLLNLQDDQYLDTVTYANEVGLSTVNTYLRFLELTYYIPIKKSIGRGRATIKPVISEEVYNRIQDDKVFRYNYITEVFLGLRPNVLVSVNGWAEYFRISEHQMEEFICETIKNGMDFEKLDFGSVIRIGKIVKNPNPNESVNVLQQDISPFTGLCHNLNNSLNSEQHNDIGIKISPVILKRFDLLNSELNELIENLLLDYLIQNK